MIMNYETNSKELIKGLTGKSVIVNDDETVSIGQLLHTREFTQMVLFHIYILN